MPEETIIEKSSLEMIIETITSVSAYVIVFLVLAILATSLLFGNKITQDGFIAFILGSALISILFKFLKEPKGKR
jgi:uncharacterized membrane protein YhhN